MRSERTWRYIITLLIPIKQLYKTYNDLGIKPCLDMFSIIVDDIRFTVWNHDGKQSCHCSFLNYDFAFSYNDKFVHINSKSKKCQVPINSRLCDLNM